MKNEEKTLGMPREGELELINRHARTPLTAEQVYVYSVTLCDNDIDRDYERFADSALVQMCALFEGKTGICDHSPKSENQSSRIFSCAVETVAGEQTSDGRSYKRLVARAYMLRTDKNRDLIAEIEGGIKKEVSVGCTVAAKSCSICGTDRKNGCIHKPGRTYKEGGRELLCHTVLSAVTDAYEWSFVAVPAQRKAGVIKSFHPKENKPMINSEVIKQLGNGREITLSAAEAAALGEYIAEQRTLCDLGKAFLLEKQKSVIKSLSGLMDGVKEETLKAVIEKMSVSELDEVYRSFSRTAPEVQLARSAASREQKNNGFMIK